MDDQKITELDEKTTIADADEFAAVDSEANPVPKTKRISGANVKSQVLSGHKDLATGVHGVGAGTVAKVGDIATDVNLSPAAQAVITGVGNLPIIREPIWQRPPTSMPRVALIFDDGWESSYTYRQLFVDQGITVCLAINTNMIGTSGYLTWEQLRELVYDYGWTISNHGKSHADFPAITIPETRTEIYDAHKKFIQEGFLPQHFVYAYGHYGTAEQRAIVSELYPYGFTLYPIVSSAIVSTTSNPYQLPRYAIDSGVTLATITAKIDGAIASNTALILYAHKIIEGEVGDEGAYEISIGKLDDVIDYIQASTAQIVHPIEAIRYSAMPGFSSHASGHQWLGTDEVNIKDLFFQFSALYYKLWTDVTGFTSLVSGTGSNTTGFAYLNLQTGATNGSKAGVYATQTQYISYSSALYRFRLLGCHNPQSSLADSEYWFGYLYDPTTPSYTQKHFAFQILNGEIWASCGDGTNGTQVDTGVALGQYGSAILYIKFMADDIKYYINGVLKATITTNRANNWAGKLTCSLINSATANKYMLVYPVMALTATGD